MHDRWQRRGALRRRALREVWITVHHVQALRVVLPDGSVVPYPRLLRLAALGSLYQRLRTRDALARSGQLKRLPARMLTLEALKPDVRLRSAMRRVPDSTPALGTARRTVGMVTGCIQQVFFAQVNEATVRVLTAEGCEVVAPRAQGCCGALSEHASREDEAADRAQQLIDVFEPLNVDAVVANVADCGSSLKEYGRLRADDPDYRARAAAFAAKVRDVSELLAELTPLAPRHPVSARVAYHDARHLAHAQGIRNQPRAILRTVPGLDLVDIPEADMCCGSASIYNLVQPLAAEELGRRKANCVLSTEPYAVVTANPDCPLQIAGTSIATCPYCTHSRSSTPLFEVPLPGEARSEPVSAHARCPFGPTAPIRSTEAPGGFPCSNPY
ncbi:MAG TPA: heterodisulfide reductase-related iron-sulfur binding cluster [Streptomyces sp.]|nr:heterodisulfide reductase-related iron-sulfur binding cluster [Streptomyces sp.]HET6359563.1 heterodisulfide reductase-related iron-sulfur binding cluster [Streptomyces sp.]